MAKTALYEFVTEGNTTRVQFADGTTRVFDFGTLPVELCQMVMAHGLKQKIADGAAIARNPDTGRAATAEDKIARMVAIADRLLSGQWKAAAGEGGPTGGMLLKALVELYPGKSVEQLTAYLSGKTDKEKAALRASSRVAPIIERMRAERSKDAVDTDGLFDELEEV